MGFPRNVQFVGGPWDGSEAVLPGAPSFMFLQWVDESWEALEHMKLRREGKVKGLMIDMEMSTYSYRLADKEYGDDEPLIYEWVDQPPKGEPHFREHILDK